MGVLNSGKYTPINKDYDFISALALFRNMTNWPLVLCQAPLFGSVNLQYLGAAVSDRNMVEKCLVTYLPVEGIEIRLLLLVSAPDPRAWHSTTIPPGV